MPIDNREQLVARERELELAKVREVQERIRREVDLTELDVETLARINEIIAEEAEKYKEQIQNFLQYDIARPFMRNEVMRRIGERNDRGEIIKIFGGDDPEGKEAARAQLEYLEKYGDDAFKLMIDELTKVFLELAAVNKQAIVMLYDRLKARGFTDDDLNMLKTDGTSNVITAWHARCEMPRLLYDRGKSPKEFLTKKLYAKAA